MPFNFSSPEYLSNHRTRKNRVSPVSRASPAHMNGPYVYIVKTHKSRRVIIDNSPKATTTTLTLLFYFQFLKRTKLQKLTIASRLSRVMSLTCIRYTSLMPRLSRVMSLTCLRYMPLMTYVKIMQHC